jgi:hypothetical protein
MALSAAQAALAQCRKAGYQVAVAVVDRSGVLQVQLRDRFASVHTVDAATQKAWSAASFRMPTANLATETQPGKPMSGLHVIAEGVETDAQRRALVDIGCHTYQGYLLARPMDDKQFLDFVCGPDCLADITPARGAGQLSARPERGQPATPTPAPAHAV